MDYTSSKNMIMGSDQYKAITHIPGWVNGLLSSDDRVSTAAAAYALVPLIYRALRLRCDNLASVPVYFERGLTQLEWPWPTTDLYELLWKTEASLLLTGGAYWLKRDNKVRTKYVEYLNPYGMTVDTIKINDRTQLRFIYSWTEGNETVSETYSQDQIVYFKEFNPRSDVLPGASSGTASIQAAALRRYGQRFASYFFEGGAMPALLLGIPASTSDAERDRTESFFRRKLSGIVNAFRIIAVKAGMVDVKTLTPPLKDLVIPELNNLALEDISAAFGIRKSILGDPANYAVSKEDWDSFWKTTVRPRGRFFEGVINRQLLAPLNLKVRFAFDELDVFQEDESQRAGSLKNLVEAGWPVDLASEVLGYDLTPEQMLRLREAASRPEPAPIIQQAAPVERAEEMVEDELTADLKRWERAASRRLKEKGSASYQFASDHIPASLSGAIGGALEAVKTQAQLHQVFRNAMTWGKQ